MKRKSPQRLDFKQRAKEKQLSRQADERDLKEGLKSREALRSENSHFGSMKVRVELKRAKSLY